MQSLIRVLSQCYLQECCSYPVRVIERVNGQTGKSLEARIKQHKYSIRSGQENNALFQHVGGFNHRINFDLSSVIKCNSNFTEINIKESRCHLQTHKNLLNTSQGLYTLDPFVATSITKFLNVRITQ